MPELIFCISKEQRENIFDSLRELEHIRSLMNGKGPEWDPRWASLPGIDADATVPCPGCGQSAGPAHRITTEGQQRPFYLRCQTCGHSWTVDE
jgi:hypothetical protein